MYSTKAYSDKSATATGAKIPFLFEKEKFTDPKPPAMPRHKGKQFLTTVPKVPAAGAGYFHPLKYAPEKFNDTTGYLRTQPLDARKRAFGSKDASRRDEFTSTVQTERYRHLLKTELKATSKLAAAPPAAPLSTSRSVPSADPLLSRIPKHTFSFGREVNTPACSKCHRDTFFCKHRPATAERRVSVGLLTSHEFGRGIENAEKPEFGHVSCTKYFYDIGHVGEN